MIQICTINNPISRGQYPLRYVRKKYNNIILAIETVMLIINLRARVHKTSISDYWLGESIAVSYFFLWIYRGILEKYNQGAYIHCLSHFHNTILLDQSIMFTSGLRFVTRNEKYFQSQMTYIILITYYPTVQYVMHLTRACLLKISPSMLWDHRHFEVDRS